MTFAILGGNSNNEAKVGAFYCNLNNAVSNANWNIDAAQSYLFWDKNQKYSLFLASWRKLTRSKHALVTC